MPAGAEDIGHDGLWSIETAHEPFMPLAIASTVTQRVTLGTAIAVAFPRNPTVLAHTCWDLQTNSQGRFILGLGTQVKGHNERRFGVPVRLAGQEAARDDSGHPSGVGTAGRTAPGCALRASFTG